ncbi:hypothetical protein SAMN05192584_11559 [Streptomyces pini]|uniref:Uncharacterized protein n=1 Tax=Streptomyces pini TaxID=1520580 RepID=A0A1I4G3V6_9ACTN|nr:hypothetical protein SAMN05192584_11559 [Streptomyces pini]
MPGGAGGREADTGGVPGGAEAGRSPSSPADGVGVGVGSGAGVLRVTDGAGGDAVAAAGDWSRVSVCCAVHPAPSSTAAAAASAARPAGPRRTDSPQDIETPPISRTFTGFPHLCGFPAVRLPEPGTPDHPPGGSARGARAGPSAHHPARL